MSEYQQYLLNREREVGPSSRVLLSTIQPWEAVSEWDKRVLNALVCQGQDTVVMEFPGNDGVFMLVGFYGESRKWNQLKEKHPDIFRLSGGYEPDETNPMLLHRHCYREPISLPPEGPSIVDIMEELHGIFDEPKD